MCGGCFVINPNDRVAQTMVIMDKVLPPKGCEPKSKNTHLNRLKTDYGGGGGCTLMHGSSHLPATEMAILMNTQQNCDQHGPYPPFPCRRDSRYIYITDLLFFATPLPPLPLEKNVHRLFLALMIEELITNSPAPNEMVLLNYKTKNNYYSY